MVGAGWGVVVVAATYLTDVVEGLLCLVLLLVVLLLVGVAVLVADLDVVDFLLPSPHDPPFPPQPLP